MPTIIGRFNELLHQLSSPSSSVTTTSAATRHPSNRPVESSRIHHRVHRANTVQPSEYKGVRRSNSTSSSRTKATLCKTSRSSKAEEHSTGQRVRHRQTSPGNHSNRQGSHQPSSKRDSVSRRESALSILHSHNSRRQQLGAGRRRHSIASVTSVTASPNCVPVKSVDSKQTMSSSTSAAMTTKVSKRSIINNNNNIDPVKASVMNAHSDAIVDDSDESLASKFARKMKISAITMKSYPANNANSQNGKKSTSSQSKKLLKSKKSSPEKDSDQGCFIDRYLNGHLTKHHPDIISGKTCYDLPVKDIERLESGVVAAYTGPNRGLLNVRITPSKPFDLADDVDFIDEDYPDSSLSSTGEDQSPHTSKSSKSSVVSSDTGEVGSSTENVSPLNTYSSSADCTQDPVAGIANWNKESDFAYGISTTLYESNPSTHRNAGDPIADSFGICVRDNSAIIALADGVNWGEKACLASRCAVHGCIDYLNKALYSAAESTRIRNTLDIFVALLRSFNAAHNLILTQGGHLTTLCAAVICQLKNSDRFIVCTCNVGDSLAYVYSPVHGVREITQGSHDIFSMRDMRDALGALGPVSGSEPELNNLTVAMTVVDAGDIVFLTSDGISDNFDPVVGKFAMPKKEQEATDIGSENKNEDKSKAGEKVNAKSGQKTRKGVQRSNSNPEKTTSRKAILHPENYTSKGLPLVSAQQRHELTLLRMEDLISNGVGNNVPLLTQTPKMTAKELCTLMVDFSTKLTMAKRHILEDPELYSENEEDIQGSEAFDKQRKRRRLAGPKLVQVPGKLDHASIAAVEIGFYGTLASKRPTSHHRTKQVHESNRTKADSQHSHKDNDARYNLRMRATLARFESQDSLDCYTESGPI